MYFHWDPFVDGITVSCLPLMQARVGKWGGGGGGSVIAVTIGAKAPSHLLQMCVLLSPYNIHLQPLR